MVLVRPLAVFGTEEACRSEKRIRTDDDGEDFLRTSVMIFIVILIYCLRMLPCHERKEYS